MKASRITAREEPVTSKIFTPEKITRLLSAAHEGIPPFVAIAGFAGHRHAEIARLNRVDIDLQEGVIGEKAGTRKR